MKQFFKMLGLGVGMMASFTLQASHPTYRGEIILDAEAHNTRLKSFSFSSPGQNWQAKSLGEREEETGKIQRILTQQSAQKRVYLPDPSNGEEIGKWQRTVITRQPYYRPFLVESIEGEPLALVELHTMPRAVMFPAQQGEILDFYLGKGLMTYDPTHQEKELLGKYRVVREGPAGMARMRFMPSESLLTRPELLQDMIKGTSAFIKKLSDLGFPLHSYWSDPLPGLPRMLMSYTALEEPLRAAYKNAGFSVEAKDIFKEYWPNEMRERLPERMVIASQFMSNIHATFSEFLVKYTHNQQVKSISLE